MLLNHIKKKLFELIVRRRLIKCELGDNFVEIAHSFVLAAEQLFGSQLLFHLDLHIGAPLGHPGQLPFVAEENENVG